MLKSSRMVTFTHFCHFYAGIATLSTLTARCRPVTVFGPQPLERVAEVELFRVAGGRGSGKKEESGLREDGESPTPGALTLTFLIKSDKRVTIHYARAKTEGRNRARDQFSGFFRINPIPG